MKEPKKKKYAKLVREFIKGVKMTVGTNYASRRSVNKNNKGVLAYRAAAEAIALYYPDRISDFELLLGHTNKDVRICVGICLVEIMKCSEEQKAHALKVVAACKETSGELDGQGLELWLNRHSEREI